MDYDLKSTAFDQISSFLNREYEDRSRLYHDCLELAIDFSVSRQESSAKLSLESYLGTPVFVAGQPWGTLDFSDLKEGKPIEALEIQLLEAMAEKLGVFEKEKQDGSDTRPPGDEP